MFCNIAGTKVHLKLIMLLITPFNFPRPENKLQETF